jgi:hypothetical protein
MPPTSDAARQRVAAVVKTLTHQHAFIGQSSKNAQVAALAEYLHRTSCLARRCITTAVDPAGPASPLLTAAR